MVVGKTARNVIAKRIHDHTGQTLSLSHGTILVRQKQSFQTDDFFSQLGDLTRKRIILGREQFNLGL